MVLKTSDDTADASAAKWTLPREQAASTDVRCPNCGATHPNPDLADTYRHCHSCAKVLRESSVCVLPHLQRNQSRRAFEGQNRLAVIAASFGHASDSKRAIAVLAEVQALVAHSTTHSRLHLPAGTPLMSSYFSKYADPAPSERKVLCLRYVVPNLNPDLTRHGEVRCEAGTDGALVLPLTLHFAVDSLPKLWINRATYGHRHSITPGLVFDVAERLTGLADLNGGDFVSVAATTDLTTLFGEPCDAIAKTLSVEYEIIGRSGQARQYELDGHLVQAIVIQNLPVVGPGVLIERAEYGWLPKDLDMKLTEVHAKAKLSTCSDDLSKWQALRNANSSPCHLPVAAVLQARIDKAQVPGSELNIGTDENLNALFGDPCPGLSRFLVVEYSLLGYGETGSDDEIIKKGGGQSRNFCMCKGGKLRLHVTAEGFLVKPMSISSQEVFPSLIVSRAYFGHPTNVLKTFDVTEPVGVLAAKGNAAKSLVISRQMDLVAAFGDPCRGIRKALTVNYQVLGMGGTLVLRITDANRLAGGLVLGYPLDKVDGGVDGKMGFSERLAISTTQTTKPTARERMQSSASQRLWSSSK
ncbi:hypothetical protein H257_07445 [Aphanomyces astaci]|uniref:Uncharacterized protein n=2 Tax=Aphanomyces astaci TaxID=112090 RepID=W4GK67_APHAT|nr:hypothetical protein H257_07445 [Aphanomyces astaci]ETV79434.1 hypothetical protein H257_07445 [Aphanomyces astaci]|eukprot:XP_009831275.1 hypothetical protein H257_07445 [Aphanomyces astaci]